VPLCFSVLFTTPAYQYPFELRAIRPLHQASTSWAFTRLPCGNWSGSGSFGGLRPAAPSGLVPPFLAGAGWDRHTCACGVATANPCRC